MIIILAEFESQTFWIPQLQCTEYVDDATFTDSCEKWKASFLGLLFYKLSSNYLWNKGEKEQYIWKLTWVSRGENPLWSRTGFLVIWRKVSGMQHGNQVLKICQFTSFNRKFFSSSRQSQQFDNETFSSLYGIQISMLRIELDRKASFLGKPKIFRLKRASSSWSFFSGKCYGSLITPWLQQVEVQ